MRAYVLLLVLILIPNLWAKDSFEKNLQLDCQGITKLHVEAGAGFLKIQGVEGAKRIEVLAEIVPNGATRQSINQNLTLTLKKIGNQAVLISKVKDRGLFEWLLGQTGNVEVNLTVHVPSDLLVEAIDGSGSTEISGLRNNLSVTDGSGRLSVHHITGNVHITDGSGELTVDHISGSCHVIDGSGSTELKKITGDVEITDGSGELILEDIGGDADVTDGSGNIRAERIHGTLTIRDGSGDIHATSIGSDLIIESDGSGEVFTRHIKGQIVQRR